MSTTYFFISFSFKSQVLLEPGYYSREDLIWENKVHTVLSENFGTLQTLSHMYDVVPKWLKKCTVRALKCYLHLNLNHSVPNWTIFLANSKQNLHPFSTLLYYCNNHKSKLLSVLVASTLNAARNGFEFSASQIMSIFLLFISFWLHQLV